MCVRVQKASCVIVPVPAPRAALKFNGQAAGADGGSPKKVAAYLCAVLVLLNKLKHGQVRGVHLGLNAGSLFQHALQ
jgi:hypothetical protein